MKLIDTGVRAWVMAHGSGARWMREALKSLEVTVPLTEGCIEDLVRGADREATAACEAADAAGWLPCLRRALAEQAARARRWTATDEPFDPQDERAQEFVKIARRYALPRPWRLSEPVAAPARRPHPLYWNWATSDQTAA